MELWEYGLKEIRKPIKVPEEEKILTWEAVFPELLTNAKESETIIAGIPFPNESQKRFIIYLKLLQLESRHPLDYEWKFFDFFHTSIKDLSFHEKIKTCALIPQVKIQGTKYRVDFMIRNRNVHNNEIIIEIDGESHFKVLDNWGEKTSKFKTEMEVYTYYTKRDRELRRMGFSVFHFTNKEVNEIQDVKTFRDFFNENIGFYPDNIY